MDTTPKLNKDGITSIISADRVPTKFDNTAAPVSTMKSPATSGLSTTDYISMMKSSATETTINLCGKKLTNGKRCQTENFGGCANTGCSVHYGWQDEVEGFRLRTF
jgi:hypothetical protein